MQLITVFLWIIGLIIMKSTTIVICKTKLKQQHQQQQKYQQQKFLIQPDNRYLSNFPEFLLEIQRNSNNNKNNNNINKIKKNFNNFKQNDEFISDNYYIGLNNNNNNNDEKYQNHGDYNVDLNNNNNNINDDLLHLNNKNHKFNKNINNNDDYIDNYNDGIIDNNKDIIKSLQTYNENYNNNYNKNHFNNNLNDNISICRNTLQQALAEYDELEQILKRADLEELMNSSDIIQLNEKRGNVANGPGCDCQIKNDLIDLGYPHYPRYLFNAVCQDGTSNPSLGGQTGIPTDDRKIHSKRCWRGSQCKPVEYKVRVLTYRTRADNLEKDYTMSLLPDILRSDWKWKTVTVAAGCFCSY